MKSKEAIQAAARQSAVKNDITVTRGPRLAGYLDGFEDGAEWMAGEAAPVVEAPQADWSKLEKIAPPEKWIEVYLHYQDLLTHADTAAFWNEQFNMANAERNQLTAEVEQFRSWKAQALACTPDWQAIAKALNLRLGTSVSDQVLPAILNLLKDRHELVIQLRRQQAYCTRYVRTYQSTARYREVEELLDKHHHSTVEP